MEMASSRRPPFDRSRELSLKKPRLNEQHQPQLQRSVNLPTSISGSTRFRMNDRGEREPDDPSRGGLQQYQQHQELVNQYKIALSELTFNSKPIITNLTIIAGENLQAAKAIAATICTNIIEVPSDQKLPSLYLLDSIVKNIGRDYIKYFATRLPEVFCKAYRQVEPPIHNSMRHLFGTWKGVFPPQSLQIIEKELGFGAAVNGPSSGSPTSRPESQSQRQPHSIHVNPKYLEARHRLQQSSMPKGADIGEADVESFEDVERLERIGSPGAQTAWTDPSMKIHNIRPQREALRGDSQLKQGGRGYGDFGFASALSRPLSTGAPKLGDRFSGQGHDKQWPGASREMEESISGQRNGYDMKRGISNYTAARSATGTIPLMQNRPRSGAEVSRSWKNSEEEEYMWDDLGTKVMDPGAVSGAKKDIWSSDQEKLELGAHAKWRSQTEVTSSFEREPSADSLSSEQKDQVPFGHPRSAQWKMQEPHQMDNSSPFIQVGHHSVTGLSPAGVSGRFSNAVSGAAGSVGQRNPSPGSLVHQRPAFSKRDPRQNFAEKDPTRSRSSASSDPRITPLSGRLNVELHDQSSQDSMPREHQNCQSDLQGQSNVSNLLAAVMKTGLLSGRPVSGELGVEHPASAALTSAMTLTTSKTVVSLSGLPHKEIEMRPLPSPPSSSLPMSNTLKKDSNVTSGGSDPFSSLLSTLVAKGLISASKTESKGPCPVKSEDLVQEQKPTVPTEVPLSVPSVPEITAAPLLVPLVEKLSAESTGERIDSSAQNSKVEVENIIGFEFKPPVLRKLHSSVIDKLLEELPHRCTLCGLQFKLKESLDSHSEWHAFRNSIPNSLNKPSRRWYSDSDKWVSGKAGFPFGYNSASLVKESPKMGEENEKVVPADEAQCVCLLCGELFEDFYSQERDEWMFKEAVYTSIPSGSYESGTSSENTVQNLIVHANCMSDDSANGLGLVSNIKGEKVV